MSISLVQLLYLPLYYFNTHCLMFAMSQRIVSARLTLVINITCAVPIRVGRESYEVL